jgi:hypothetical protein
MQVSRENLGDDPRPHEPNESVIESTRRIGMEDARFLQRRANRCYQLAWQSFDLRVAQKLNLLGNEHTQKARELRSQESNRTPDEETGRSKKHR